jgi:hypothetical protein
MREVYTQILIEAPVEKIWSVLTDLASYEEWNPFVVFGRGQIKPGEKITVRAKPKGSRGMTFTPRVVRYDPPRAFSWLGHLFVPGLADGEHIHELIPQADGKSVLYIHRDEFSGLLIPLLWKRLSRVTRQGFEGMNGALKTYLE